MRAWQQLLICGTLLAAIGATARAAAPVLTIELKGLDEEVRLSVLPLLTIEQERTDPALTEARIRNLHARAPRDIRRALEPLGYYRPNVTSELRERQGEWTAIYDVEPGPALRVSAIDVQLHGDARQDPAFKELVDTFPLHVGQRLEHALYENGKRALLNLAAERGYFDAQLVRHELRLDLEQLQAQVVLELDAGRRYRFGEISFEQDFFEREFLDRFVPFAPGEGYSNSAVLQLQMALSDTDYFERVEVQPRRDLVQDGAVPIEVKLTLRAANKYTFGVGYGTDTGARGKLGWERRLINSTGHRFGADLELSEIRTLVTSRYRIPVFDPRTDELVFSVSRTDDHPVASRSIISKFGGSLNYSRWILRESLALTYQTEEFETGSDSGRVQLVLPSATWEYVSTKDRMHPPHGGRVQFQLSGASETLGSDVSFLQARLAGKLVYPGGGNGRFIARADGGYTQTPEFENVPASFRYYAGGSQSVRGYRYQALGPRDENGDVVGGRYLMVGSLEYDYRLFGDWGAAVFYDGGRAFNDPDDASSKGAGFGVRWYLPIGVARLDFAEPLDVRDADWRIHFSIGPDL